MRAEYGVVVSILIGNLAEYLVEGLLLPGAPPNRACLIKQRGPNRYHWHLYKRPANGGTIPGKKPVFRHVSILFRPHAVRRVSTEPGETGKLVEAPGTAPGSTVLITQAVYRHSRQAGAVIIG